MLAEIENAKTAGAKGVVFGCLHPNRQLNVSATVRLTEKAKSLGLETTFHRAIDFVPNQAEVLEQLIGLGINRVLTSGGKPTAAEGLEGIEALVLAANGRIQIMAGSGVNAQIVPALKTAKVDAIHFTTRKKTADEWPGMGANYDVDEAKILEILSTLKT
jgi:copper homeostasis protein